MLIKSIPPLTALLCAALLTACAGARHVKPASEKRRPTLRYTPKRADVSEVKYPLTVGVADIGDRRQAKFYGGNDGFFREPLIKGIADVLYNELKSGGVFAKVKRIPVLPPRKLTRMERAKLASEHGVDLLLITDLTRFNLRREKAGDWIADSFANIIEIAWIIRLIHLDSGTVIWADQQDRTSKQIAANGALSPSMMGSLTNKTMREMTADMNMLIYRTGKRMAQP
ncbi:MAG: hypothetical protein ABIJ96_07180 [Elusimicrobiota bacterium]